MARVLLAAEEEPASHRVLARLALEAAGHEVEEVHDGQSALAQADLLRPEVLVLDTALPVYDGFQVLDRIHRHYALRHLPVVMLSTISRDVGGELSRSLGAVRFLPRPFTAVDLTEAVDAALATPAAETAAPALPPLPSLSRDARRRGARRQTEPAESASAEAAQGNGTVGRPPTGPEWPVRPVSPDSPGVIDLPRAPRRRAPARRRSAP